MGRLPSSRCIRSAPPESMQLRTLASRGAPDTALRHPGNDPALAAASIAARGEQARPGVHVPHKVDSGKGAPPPAVKTRSESENQNYESISMGRIAQPRQTATPRTPGRSLTADSLHLPRACCAEGGNSAPGSASIWGDCRRAYASFSQSPMTKITRLITQKL